MNDRHTRNYSGKCTNFRCLHKDLDIYYHPSGRRTPPHSYSRHDTRTMQGRLATVTTDLVLLRLKDGVLLD